MKEFNLDAALNGEPINANGQKACIAREVTDLLDDKSLRRFVVIFPESSTNAEVWDEYDFTDDIRMWEEPKKQINIEDLPKPFKPKDGEPFYYVYCGKIYCDHEYSESSPSYKSFSQNGQCFRTEEDAQKWIDFMKGMLE